MFGIVRRYKKKINQENIKQIILRSPILRCFSNLRAKTILYIYISCSMLIILASIILLFSLITQQISKTLQESSEIIFELNSKRQQDIAKQSLEIFWVTFIHSVSQPLITLHRLYNFQQLQNNLKVNSQEGSENCYRKQIIEIERSCVCDLNNSTVSSNQNDLKNMVNNLIQFQTALPTQQFGVQQYLGFFEDKSQQLFNYPCLDFTGNNLYDPKTRPWYIEAEKAYNLSNFLQYSVRLTHHYKTIPFNDIRFSIALPLINFKKSMIGALRVHIQSKILQDTIYKGSNKTNLILTTNDGMLLVNNLFNKSDFELGTDYFYNETITGFNYQDWQAIISKKLSNCDHVDTGFICRQNKIDKQEYYMIHTSLEQYNLIIILYQTKFEYQQYIQEHQMQMTIQIQDELIKGIAYLTTIGIVISFISSVLLEKMIRPLQKIAWIFQINKLSSSQSITQRFLKCKISNSYAGIFKKPNCLISKDIFLFCQCIEQFITNFSTVKKKSNSIYEHLDSIEYPKKEEKDQIDFLDYFQQQILNNKIQEQEINQTSIKDFITKCLVGSIKKEY